MRSINQLAQAVSETTDGTKYQVGLCRCTPSMFQWVEHISYNCQHCVELYVQSHAAFRVSSHHVRILDSTLLHRNL